MPSGAHFSGEATAAPRTRPISAKTWPGPLRKTPRSVNGSTGASHRGNCETTANLFKVVRGLKKKKICIAPLRAAFHPEKFFQAGQEKAWTVPVRRFIRTNSGFEAAFNVSDFSFFHFTTDREGRKGSHHVVVLRLAVLRCIGIWFWSLREGVGFSGPAGD